MSLLSSFANVGRPLTPSIYFESDLPVLSSQPLGPERSLEVNNVSLHFSGPAAANVDTSAAAATTTKSFVECEEGQPGKLLVALQRDFVIEDDRGKLSHGRERDIKSRSTKRPGIVK